MIFFILRRLLLVIPTLIGVMVPAMARALPESFQWTKVYDSDGSCWIVHQHLDANTGGIIVGAAVRLLPTTEDTRLYLVVGAESVTRAEISLLSRLHWSKMQNNEQMDERVPRYQAPFTCSELTCKAVLNLTSAMLNIVASAGGLVVQTAGKSGRVVLPVPLSGFVEAVAGAQCNHHCFNWDPVLNHFRAMN